MGILDVKSSSVMSNIDIIDEYFSYELIGNITKQEIIRAFITTDPKEYLDELDYNLWLSLPKFVEVYRGCNKEELEELGVPLGISYTLSKDVAERFAKRTDGCVIKALVPKEVIKCYTNRRREEEVIVLGFPFVYIECEVM